MANSDFTIKIESFGGGLSHVPNVGAPNQYASASGMDLWSEPGVVMPNRTFKQYTSASLPSFTATGQVVYDVVDVGTSSNASLANKIYGVGSDNSGALRLIRRETTNTWVSLASLASVSALDAGDHIELVTYQEREWPLIIGSSKNGVFQINGAVGTVWQFHYDTTSYPAFCVEKKDGYAYYGWATNDTYPEEGYIGRVDYTTSLSSLPNTTTNIREYIGLEPGEVPADMERFGDFIAIVGARRTSLNLGNTSFVQQSFKGNSTLYIWDGVTKVFDKKVPIIGMEGMAVKQVKGRLFIIGRTGSGLIELREWLGENTVALRATYNSTLQQSESYRGNIWVLPTSVTVEGDMLMFGVSGNGSYSNHGMIYGFDTLTNTPHMVYQRQQSASSQVRMLRSLRGVIFHTQTDSTGNILQESDQFLGAYRSIGSFTDDAVVTTPFFTPDPSKLFKLKRVRVRHSSISSLSNFFVQFIPNRNVDADNYTSSATNIVTKTGDGVNGDVGDTGIAAIRDYSIKDANGNFPILDAMALKISMTSNASLRERIYLPIVIEGEVIDNPQ